MSDLLVMSDVCVCGCRDLSTIGDVRHFGDARCAWVICHDLANLGHVRHVGDDRCVWVVCQTCWCCHTFWSNLAPYKFSNRVALRHLDLHTPAPSGLWRCTFRNRDSNFTPPRAVQQLWLIVPPHFPSTSDRVQPSVRVACWMA